MDLVILFILVSVLSNNLNVQCNSTTYFLQFLHISPNPHFHSFPFRSDECWCLWNAYLKLPAPTDVGLVGILTFIGQLKQWDVNGVCNHFVGMGIFVWALLLLKFLVCYSPRLNCFVVVNITTIYHAWPTSDVYEKWV